MSGHDPGDSEDDLFDDLMEDNLAPPGWPLYPPTQSSLEHREQALTQDRNGPSGSNVIFDSSSTVVVNGDGRYLWSWPQNSIQAAIVQGRQPHFLRIPVSDEGTNNATGSQRYTLALAYGPAETLPYRSAEELNQAFARAYAPRCSSSHPNVNVISPFMEQCPYGNMNVLARPGPDLVFPLPPEQPTIDPRLLAPPSPPSPIRVSVRPMCQHVDILNHHMGQRVRGGIRPSAGMNTNRLQGPSGVRMYRPPARPARRTTRQSNSSGVQRTSEGRLVVTLRSRAVCEEWERLENRDRRLVVTIRSRAVSEAWERLNHHGQ